MEIFTNSNYLNMPDEKIIGLINSGDKQAQDVLINRYQDIVKMRANKYFMYGAEKNDIIQEGMIGLFKAIKDFEKEKNISFKTFANLCIERQLITAIKTANRQKHAPLNSAISINSTINAEEEDNKELIELIQNNTIEDPSDTIAKTEYYNTVYSAIDKSLSKHEKDVLMQYQTGKSYVEIAKVLDCKPKSVDTAMTRIRRKANKIKNEINKAFI